MNGRANDWGANDWGANDWGANDWGAKPRELTLSAN
jgi:hypothetical protein